MLKRIRVRGKLLLLIAAPIAAVLVFAATGVVDRRDNSDFQDREARIADFADAGSDLSLAVQVQRVRGLAADAGAVVDLEESTAILAGAVDGWLQAAESVKGDITDPDLVTDIDDLTTSLGDLRAGADAMSPDTLTAAVALASRRVALITPQLVDQSQDLELFRALSEHLRISQIQQAVGEITVQGAAAIESRSISPVIATPLNSADADIVAGSDQFLTTADASYAAMLEQLIADGFLPTAIGDSVRDVEFVIDAGQPVDVALAEWLATGEEKLVGVNSVSDALLEDAAAAAAAAATTARTTALNYLILAGSVTALAIVMAALVGRSISHPLTRLTRNAEQLAAEELPALVESMRSGGRTAVPELTPIEVSGRDEIATLATAFSGIQQVTVEVAEEQGDLLQRGISDIFVNLARRNQSLLDRQIDFIDELESREENPDQLENLFRLDHLATRMRRNAESLLVLAGSEPTRRRGRPVAIADVVRVAMGEIEDYGRIRLHAMDEAAVGGPVAADLAHVLSELMENATQFSPPDTSVDTEGRRLDDGSYLLTITDSGIGMGPAALADANQALAEPPVIGLDLSRSLGFTVVSRLADRLGVTVSLAAANAAETGVTATVELPPSMVTTVTADDSHAETPDPLPTPDGMSPIGVPSSAEAGSLGVLPSTGDASAPTEPTEPMMDPAGLALAPFAPAGDPTIDSAPPAGPAPFLPAADEPTQPAPTTSSLAPPPAPPTESPFGDAPAQTPAGLPQRTSKQPVASDDHRAAGDVWDVFGAPATPPAPPTDPTADVFAPLDETPPPLPRRTKSAPDAGDAGAASESSAPPAATSDAPEPIPTRPAAEIGAVDSSVTQAGLIRRTPRSVDVPDSSKYNPGTEATPTASPSRSPEEVREMLSRYRSGIRKGRTGDDRSNQQG